jgi:hypothetical protein
MLSQSDRRLHPPDDRLTMSSPGTGRPNTSKETEGMGRVWKSVAEIKETFGLSDARYNWWKSLGLSVHEFPDGSTLLTETDFDLWTIGRGVTGEPPQEGEFDRTYGE